jgi:hypothetical protein
MSPDAPAAAPSGVAGPKHDAPWLISPRQDLLWLQGSAAAGVALLIYFVAFPKGPLTVLGLLVWGVLFDGTHVLGTYARTYLARDEASKSALPGPWSWALLLVGPAVALTGHAKFHWFLLGAYLWAYWHLVRQHYGLLVLYRRKAKATDETEAKLETALLWVGCLYPYLRFSLTPAYADSGLPVLAPAGLTPRVADLAFAVVLTALVGVLAPRVKLGPRHLLLAIVIAFHGVVFALLHELLAITATLTLFHNLQYHRIVWQYERGHGRQPLGGLKRYLAFGVALGAAWYVPRVLGASLAGPGTLRDVLLGLGWGVAFHHYLVDGRIWKVRKQPAVAAALEPVRGA